jgi:hypothetical protein
MGAKRNAYRIFVGMPKGKRPLGRPRSGWEDITIDLREIGWADRDWFGLAQNREQSKGAVNTVMNLQVSYNVGKFLSS